MLAIAFAYILEMSLGGSVAILAVLLLRLLLRKAPKAFSYALWLVVLLRLLCPVSIPSPVSVLPDTGFAAKEYRFAHDPITVVDAGKAVYQAAEDAVQGQLDAQQVYIDVPSQLGGSRLRAASLWDICVMAGQYLWAMGMAVILIYSVISYIRLRRRLIGATRVQNGIYMADHIASAFVLGVFFPKIYLPSGLEAKEQDYILAHERHHIRRGDHVLKPMAFFVLMLHWFNPLVWVAYTLFTRDMEMSCDEAVVSKLGTEIRADYAKSLLRLASGKGGLGISPLAFGEGDTKGRIENLAKWKKPLLWVVIACILVYLCAGVCLLTDPMPASESIQPGGTSAQEAFDSVLSYAGYTAEAEFIAASRNALELAKSNARHLPTYSFGTREELDSFVQTYGKYLAMDRSYEEVPSFRGVMERYDDGFFEKNKLVLVYIQSTDSSCRYRVHGVLSGSNQLRVQVKQVKDSWENRQETVGWFLSMGVPHGMLTPSGQVDALLVSDDALQAAVPMISENGDAQLSNTCEIRALLPATDFSNLSNKAKKAVADEWRTYEGMTQWERQISSRLFGCVHMDSENWESVVKDLGVSLQNPLEAVSWVEATDIYGGISTDPTVPHIKTTLLALESMDRQVGQVHVTAGYRTEDIRVVLGVTLCRSGGIYTTMGIGDGLAETYGGRQNTGSGIPVVFTASEEEASYSDLTAWWIREGALFSLRLVGDGQTQVYHAMEKLLAQM